MLRDVLNSLRLHEVRIKSFFPNVNDRKAIDQLIYGGLNPKGFKWIVR